MAILVIESAAVPEFVRVIDRKVVVLGMLMLANDRRVGFSVTAGVPTPVPVSVTDRGDPAALSVIVTAAPRLPAAVGVNVTEIAQFAPAATLDPQLLV